MFNVRVRSTEIGINTLIKMYTETRGLVNSTVRTHGRISMRLNRQNNTRGLLASLILLIGGPAVSGNYQRQWEPVPGIMLYWLLFESGGEVVRGGPR